MATPPDAQRKQHLEGLFPLLAGRKYAIREAPNKNYNCVAWALGSTAEWWWPDDFAIWPIRDKRVNVESFQRLFESMGFELTSGAGLEAGYTKIALYLLNGVPTHIARIESDMLWSSKIGREELIEHEPDGLNGTEYGLPALFFRKKTS